MLQAEIQFCSIEIPEEIEISTDAMLQKILKIQLWIYNALLIASVWKRLDTLEDKHIEEEKIEEMNKESKFSSEVGKNEEDVEEPNKLSVKPSKKESQNLQKLVNQEQEDELLGREENKKELWNDIHVSVQPRTPKNFVEENKEVVKYIVPTPKKKSKLESVLQLKVESPSSKSKVKEYIKNKRENQNRSRSNSNDSMEYKSEFVREMSSFLSLPRAHTRLQYKLEEKSQVKVIWWIIEWFLLECAERKPEREANTKRNSWMTERKWESKNKVSLKSILFQRRKYEELKREEEKMKKKQKKLEKEEDLKARRLIKKKQKEEEVELSAKKSEEYVRPSEMNYINE